MMNEVTKQEAKTLRLQAQDARTKSDRAQWEQAVALHAIYYSGYSIGETQVAPIYELWGHESWHDYVEGEIGIHVGKANRLVSTAHFFVVKMGKSWNKRILSPTRMRTLSTSKMITHKNLNQWIIKALNMTPCQLDAELLGRNVGTRSMGFTGIKDRDYEIVKQQLELIKSEGGFANLGEALVSVFIKRRKSA